jgi:phosphoglucosamine mutase
MCNKKVLCDYKMNEKIIKFGTDGIRGKVDKFPFRDDDLVKLGKAIGMMMVNKLKAHRNPKVLIASDTRMSCNRVKKMFLSGLSSYSINVVDADILPTPVVHNLISYNKSFDYGIVITASHNPYNYSGIKILTASAFKLCKEDEDLISRNFEKIEQGGGSVITSKNYTFNLWEDSFQYYKQSIKSFFPTKFLFGIKIVLDCANGATYKIAPEVFKEFGATVIVLSDSPDGRNINHKCGALHPEALQYEVLESKADIGFAFDGDGDRVIVVNKNGEIKNGDDILAILEQSREFSDLAEIVGTIMSNSGFEEYLKSKGKELIRTSVGDKYITQKLSEKNLLIGGEPSGHIIIKNYLPTGDGIFVALKTLESIKANNNLEIKTFNSMPQSSLNLPINRIRLPLNKSQISLIDKYNNTLNPGRVIVRCSGTEPVLRITVEAKSKQLADGVVKNLAEEINRTLQIS